MEQIDPNTFDKTQLKINIPAYNGEMHYSKISYKGMPIIIQTPQTLTKQKIVKQGKKLFCDIMFNSIETEFLHWIEELEIQLHKILFENSSNWFDQTFQLDDIETLFVSPVKMFKSGKYYILRAYLKESLRVFKDNSGIGLTYLDIVPENNIISILEFKGIKYTSRDFQLDIEIKQIMIIQSDPYENNCFIKINKPIEIKESNLSKTDTDLNEVILKEIEYIEDSNIKLTSNFIEIYNEAKKEASETKQIAINAHLKLEEIRKKYNIEPDSE
jgi:hypothetical protein